ncbi:CHY zinc finger protein [Halorubrum sp. DTA98]|uniref:CHY zinc finger protein n=1 Tax=Halorubrum sp. DTA98 TaxID=3402163 RepID=UPI003AAF4515
MPGGRGTDTRTGADRRTTGSSAIDDRFPVPLRGIDVDPDTRCVHWDGAVDVIALRFGCCGAYYPCFECHDAVVDHGAEPWPRERFDDPAVLCGVCSATLTAAAYLDCGDACPRCGTAFNPGCRRHRDRYFEE